MRKGVIDMPRYDKYIVGKAHKRMTKGNYVDSRRYKDSIYFKSINKVVMHIDIPIVQLKKQGLNITQFRTLLVKQYNPETQRIECPICHSYLNSGKISKLVIDHDHKTGKVRGVLCSNCNTAIGQFRESKQILEKAIEYLSQEPLKDALKYTNSVAKLKQEKRSKIREDLLAKQGNVCAICGRNTQENTKWVIDHDHSTDKIRGVLCHSCNLGLGLLKENIQSIKSAINYLEANK